MSLTWLVSTARSMISMKMEHGRSEFLNADIFPSETAGSLFSLQGCLCTVAFHQASEPQVYSEPWPSLAVSLNVLVLSEVSPYYLTLSQMRI